MEDNIQHHLLLSNCHLTKEVAMLKKRVDTIESVSLVVPITFNIHNCHSVFRSDDIIFIYQQPFLTHCHGYRLIFCCALYESMVWFALIQDGMETTNLPYPKRLTLLVTIINQMRDNNHLQLRGEFELKHNDVVMIEPPYVKVNELLRTNALGIQYVKKDTLCCKFDTKLL